MCVLAKYFLLAALAVTVSSHSLGPQDVVFHLFTRNNQVQSQVLFPTVSSILMSNFDPSRRTILTIHGQGDFENFNAFVVSSHLDAENVNVVAVDWSVGSTTYIEGVSQADQCGLIIAQFINLLSSEFNYPPQSYRIVGVGLGGHVAGIAGRLVNGVISEIVAIDPSLHGWTHHPGRLGPDAANIVEVLHTTGGFLGYDHPLGNLDFYANGGSHQNGCGIDINCSHVFGIAFYSESITAPIRGGNNFVGTSCDSYEQAISMSCQGPRDAVFGGPSVKTSGSGIYTFGTEFTSPFAQG